MDSFFEQASRTKCTWSSRNGVTKNEIDFIIANKKAIIQDDTVDRKATTEL